MKDELRSPARHKLDHAIPIVIHHPEDDLPLFARWVHRAMANRVRFWSLLGGTVVALIGLAVLANGLSLGKATTNQVWTRLELAKTPAERVEIAREFSDLPAARWALLQAATDYFNQGFADLPANRDAALPALKKALDLFEQVAREAPENSAPARVAAFGVARTHEARNELEKAIKQYERVAARKAWAGTEEAKEAARLARELRKPENIAFYKELYAFKPFEATLPPGGRDSFNMTPFLPPNHPPVKGSRTPLPFELPPPPPSPDGKPAASSPPPGTGLPPDVFGPEPKAEPTKAELPGDVFKPEPGGGAPKS